MGAAVDEGPHRSGLVPIENDRRLADVARPEIPRVGDFNIETEKAPDGPAEDPLLLTPVDIRVVIEAVGHPAVIEGRPNLSGYHHYHSPAHSVRDTSSAWVKTYDANVS